MPLAGLPQLLPASYYLKNCLFPESDDRRFATRATSGASCCESVGLSTKYVNHFRLSQVLIRPVSIAPFDTALTA